MNPFHYDLDAPVFRLRDVHPSQYILDEDLINAVKVAMTLDQPLLLTGEPGTGKTRLAHKIAWDLSQQNEYFLEKPLVFSTKTTSVSQDMFYHYDALRHFHDANIRKVAGDAAPASSDYIELRALGQAIALSQEAEINAGKYVHEQHPKSSVVLLDEIDKAPRDFPNDILHELENLEFFIKEDGNYRIQKGKEQRILIILTSNSEKTLPEAFLRRCVFYHIPFPSRDRLSQIVRSQFGEESQYSDERLIDHFERIRAIVRKKKPATAEFIAWLRILEMHDFFRSDLNFQRLDVYQKKTLKMSYTVLAKTREDLEAIESLLSL